MLIKLLNTDNVFKRMLDSLKYFVMKKKAYCFNLNTVSGICLCSRAGTINQNIGYSVDIQ